MLGTANVRLAAMRERSKPSSRTEFSMSLFHA